MAQSPAQEAPHPDLHVAHSIPGRIRLRTPKIRGRPRHAQEIVRKLSAVPGVRRAGANPATGSITVHYHPSALDAVEFFAEIAAALGLIAEGIGPGEVEAVFKVLGVSPAEVRESWGAGIGPNIAPGLALFAAGVLIGRRLGSS
jgi:Heavy metal associated domain 2